MREIDKCEMNPSKKDHVKNTKKSIYVLMGISCAEKEN